MTVSIQGLGNTYLGNQLGSPEKSPLSWATASPPRFISVRCTQAMFFPGKEKGACCPQQSWGPDTRVLALS